MAALVLALGRWFATCGVWQPRQRMTCAMSAFAVSHRGGGVATAFSARSSSGFRGGYWSCGCAHGQGPDNGEA